MFPETQKIFYKVRKYGISRNGKFGYSKVYSENKDIWIKFVISKKNIKDAVDRNLIKRRLKNAFMEYIKTNEIKVQLFYNYKSSEILKYKDAQKEAELILS